jgi:hypothetical protein
MWDISTTGLTCSQVMQDVRVKLNSVCHGKGSTQEEDSLHQKIGLTFKEEISKVLHLEHNFVWS